MAKQKSTDDPNAGLDLSGIDYTNLTGANFEAYKEIESKLEFGKKYDFEVWAASSKLKFAMDEDTGEKYQVMSGIQLNGANPIEVTRISALQARELNQHVTHLLGNEHRATSKYLLLKKPAKVAEVAE